jgi:hypothetical protein
VCHAATARLIASLKRQMTSLHPMQNGQQNRMGLQQIGLKIIVATEKRPVADNK